MITFTLCMSALILILFAFTICALFFDFNPFILTISNGAGLILCLVNYILLFFIILEKIM